MNEFLAIFQRKISNQFQVRRYANGLKSPFDKSEGAQDPVQPLSFNEPSRVQKSKLAPIGNAFHFPINQIVMNVGSIRHEAYLPWVGSGFAQFDVHELR